VVLGDVESCEPLALGEVLDDGEDGDMAAIKASLLAITGSDGDKVEVPGGDGGKAGNEIERAGSVMIDGSGVANAVSLGTRIDSSSPISDELGCTFKRRSRRGR
jgi:hypothetical protein